jgi:hypothetical protein
MEYDPGTELTSEERAAFAALPSERVPSRLLEARTLAALREAGWLAPRGRTRVGGAGWLSGGLAAAAVLLATGFAMGQWVAGGSGGERPVAEARDPFASAARVQQTGTAYVEALAQLARLADSNATAQGREAAMTALRTALEQLTEMARRDSAHADRGGGSAAPPADVIQVVWF